ncbi:FkbM family methyltransferase [Candidatus Pelagibacter bacterium nBUS_32]|uniref:FkbM family methyltransferase n=1 Tax=Candidatus Pelagibacter bacterium nBUS_32 TaxID=3374192 RepID=UPI003EB95403
MIRAIKNNLIIILKRAYIKLRLYLLFSGNIFPQDLLKQFLNYKKFIKKKKISNLKNIIDLGANSGNWSILFKTIHKNSNFFLIEANSKHIDKIKKISNFFHIGLLDKSNGFKNFYVYEAFNGTGSSIFKENSNHKYTIKRLKTSTLDKVLNKKFSKKSYDLLKLDTQGSELDILKGATNTLRKTRYIITEMQIQNYNFKSPNYSELNNFLKKKGFKKVKKLYSHIVNGKISQSDVMYVNKNFKKVI